MEKLALHFPGPNKDPRLRDYKQTFYKKNLFISFVSFPFMLRKTI